MHHQRVHRVDRHAVSNSVLLLIDAYARRQTVRVMRVLTWQRSRRYDMARTKHSGHS
jgi:hypothetical protein